MKYRVTTPYGPLGATCPPPWIKLIFPLFVGELVFLDTAELIVEFPTETTVVPNPNFVVDKWDAATDSWVPV